MQHPASQHDLTQLLQHAEQDDLGVRARGSRHSEDAAIFADRGLDVALDRMAEVVIDREARRVTVGAGCRFGADPRDPTGRSRWDVGLCAQLEAAGLALPSLGGVTHQTVAGFLMTGSEGGSIRHSFQRQVASLTLVDGRGRTHHLSRGDDAFAAAGVSLGLFGVVTSLTLDCVERFDVEGEETVTSLPDAEVDLFSSGPNGVAAFLEREPYARLMWWPQPGVERLAVWKARPSERTRRGPYEPFPRVLGSGLPMQVAAGAALRLIGARPQRTLYAGLRTRRCVERLLSPLYRSFVPEGRQAFGGAWHRVIPLDDAIEERLMPVRFTEIWVGLPHAAELMSRLANAFAELGYAASGSFVCEVYGGPESPFWMSPGYGRPSVRVNVFWLDHGRDDPARELFPTFWDLARDLDSRLHWGKVLDPRDVHLAERYPMREEFLAMRERYDPDERFLTDYWRRHLGLDRTRVAVPRAPVDRARPFFGLDPSDADFVEGAPVRVDVGFETTAEPDRVLELFRTDARPWLPDMVGYHPLTDPPRGPGAVVDEEMSFMTLRVRCVADEPGLRWVASVDACSLPLATSMVEQVEVERVDGRTRATWSVCYEPLPALAPLEPVVRPVVRAMFQRWADAAALYLAGEAA